MKFSNTYSVSAALLFAILMSACGQSQPEAAAEATTAEPAAAHIDLPESMQAKLGLSAVTAGPATIAESLSLYGTITAQPQRLRTLDARFPGVLRSIDKDVGDSVNAGERVATVQANDSLSVYTVTSPINGRVIQRLAQPGETVDSMPLLVVADLSQVRAELDAFASDTARLQSGQEVRLRLPSGAWDSGSAQIAYIEPTADRSTQSRRAIANVDNASSRWAPGQFVTAQVVVARHDVAVAVPADAIQDLDGQTTVFVADAQGFAPRTVSTGVRDNERVEITSGLKAGETVASGNTFMLRSELLTQGEE